MNHSYSIDSIFFFLLSGLTITHPGWKIWAGAPDINLHGDKLFPPCGGAGVLVWGEGGRGCLDLNCGICHTCFFSAT